MKHILKFSSDLDGFYGAQIYAPLKEIVIL